MDCGAVVIGRNEGLRLDACLKSLVGQAAPIVYVDSGSDDDSLDIARALGVDIIELDLSKPFTAARARNAGFERLMQIGGGGNYVQFVDGDCVIAADWVAAAQSFMDDHADVAVACGMLREKFPESSIYNKLCDVEWNMPLGEVITCGGIAMIRADLYERTGGFRDDVIAGEEPELCARFRQQGWKIWHIDVEMAIHDAAMTRFGQWWLRNIRTGNAYAIGASLHGKSPQRLWVRRQRSALMWGLILPLAILGASALNSYAAAALLIYPLQILRVAFHRRDLGDFALVYAGFMTLTKFAEMLGIIQFYVGRAMGAERTIIEYKDASKQP